MATKFHPSEILQAGEVRDFLHACEVDRQQSEYEFWRFPEMIDDEDRRIHAANLARIDTAERLYREIVLPALEVARAQCVEALTAADLDSYARALDTDDYRGLAI